MGVTKMAKHSPLLAMRIRKWRHENGAVLVEFAVILSIFLLLILGGLDLERMANAKSNVDWIAQQIATCTKAKSCAGATPPSLASGFGMDSKNISPKSDANPITVTYQWQPISPFFKAQTLTSTATAP
jgi:Flp pilus assembly pilin Flp